MPPMHPSMMVAHSVEVIQIVMREGHVGRLVLLPEGMLPQRRRPGPIVQVLHALTPLDHVRGHVQSRQGEMHQSRQLVPPVTHLFKRCALVK